MPRCCWCARDVTDDLKWLRLIVPSMHHSISLQFGHDEITGKADSRSPGVVILFVWLKAASPRARSRSAGTASFGDVTKVSDRADQNSSTRISCNVWQRTKDTYRRYLKAGRLCQSFGPLPIRSCTFRSAAVAALSTLYFSGMIATSNAQPPQSATAAMFHCPHHPWGMIQISISCINRQESTASARWRLVTLSELWL